MLWGDCGGNGYYASTKYKYWSWSLTNKVKQDDVQGGYFHRATGERTRIKGSFLNLGTRIYRQEISLSLDYEEGKTYEFVMQKLDSVYKVIITFTFLAMLSISCSNLIIKRQ